MTAGRENIDRAIDVTKGLFEDLCEIISYEMNCRSVILGMEIEELGSTKPIRDFVERCKKSLEEVRGESKRRKEGVKS